MILNNLNTCKQTFMSRCFEWRKYLQEKPTRISSLKFLIETILPPQFKRRKLRFTEYME